MSTATVVEEQSNVVEEVVSFLEEQEPRILSIEEQAKLQVLLWQLRDNAGNARICRDLAVWMNAMLGITEEAFLLAREMKAVAA